MMLNVKKFIFNSFQVNTYILYDESGKCVIVDPACYQPAEEKLLEDYLSENSLDPVFQINTHCHVDHVLGLHFVKNRYQVPFLAHDEEKKILQNGHLMGEVFGFSRDPFPMPDRSLVHGKEVRFGSSVLRVLHVPGHSPGSLALWCEESAFVITGDALFAGSIGRTDLPGGNYDTLIKSIREQLFVLPGETRVFPGHGEASTIEKEVRENPFF